MIHEFLGLFATTHFWFVAQCYQSVTYLLKVVYCDFWFSKELSVVVA